LILKILYIYKKSKSNDWSNILNKQYYYINKRAETIKYEVETSSIAKYIMNVFSLLKLLNVNEFDRVIIHHTICAYPLLIARMLSNKKRLFVVLASHESEMMFSLRMKITDIRNLLRGFKLYHIIPMKIVDKVIFLNVQPYIALGIDINYSIVNYLGFYSDRSISNEMKLNRKNNVFFPHNIKRLDKGYKVLYEVMRLDKYNKMNLFFPDKTPYDEMIKFYIKSDIVIIPSIAYETYSLVLIEAMFYNRYIIASNKLGLSMNLLEKYDINYLKSKGLFIVNPTHIEIENAIDDILNMETVDTRELFILEGLDLKKSTDRLLDEVLNI